MHNTSVDAELTKQVCALFFKFKRRLCIQYTLLSGSLNTHMAGHGSKHICHVPGKNSCGVSIMCTV